MRIVMRTPFEVFGPFELEKEKVVDQEYQKIFWGECDTEYPGLSEANGLYVLSLRIAANYKPNYVGITSLHILVKILNDFVHQRGKLCLHLLAKPKANKTNSIA
jgi:hypothetical protein